MQPFQALHYARLARRLPFVRLTFFTGHCGLYTASISCFILKLHATVTKIFLFVKCRPVTTIDKLSTILDSSQSFNMTYNLLYHVGLDVRFFWAARSLGFFAFY